mgnify:FL=1
MSNEKIKSMIDNIDNQNHIDAESDFKSIMSDKVGQALEKERQVQAKAMVTKHMPDQPEETDEVW